MNAVDAVCKYVEGLVEGYFVLSAESCVVARLHGDFHGRNVLINRDGESCLIDFGRADLYPRLADAANLDVDLLLRVLGSDDGSCWDANAIEPWMEVVKRSFPLQEPQEASGSCVLALRCLIHHGVVSQLENVSKREYASTLLFHLLRYVRFSTTPMPKKVLACRWAASLLDRFSTAS